MTINEFLSKNDKLITFLVSVVAGGIIGYFSGIMAVKEQIAGVSERVAHVEEAEENLYKPLPDKMKEVDLIQLKLSNEIGNLNNHLGLLERQIGAIEQEKGATDKIMQLHLLKIHGELEDVKKETIVSLTNFLEGRQIPSSASQIER